MLIAEVAQTKGDWLLFGTAVLTFLGLITNQWFSERRLKLEQKHQMAMQAKELKAHSDAGRQKIAEHLEKKIDENTNISRTAFEVGNNFNEKLAKLAEDMERINKTGTRASTATLQLVEERMKRMENLIIRLLPEGDKVQAQLESKSTVYEEDPDA